MHHRTVTWVGSNDHNFATSTNNVTPATRARMSIQPEMNSQRNIGQEAYPDVHTEINVGQLPTISEGTVHIEAAQPIEVDLASDSGYGEGDEWVIF